MGFLAEKVVLLPRVAQRATHGLKLLLFGSTLNDNIFRVQTQIDEILKPLELEI